MMIWWTEHIDWMIFVYCEWWISIAATKTCAGIVWLRFSSNQTVRCFNLKKLKTIWGIKLIFCFHWNYKKISGYFGLCHKILLANQFAGFFTFVLFNLLILILGVHCYTVLVYICNHLGISVTLKFNLLQHNFDEIYAVSNNQQSAILISVFFRYY